MGPNKIARVLIVDDEHVIADTLRIIFSKAGYESCAVYSAEEAIAVVQAGWIPEFALLDVHLPGMNGLSLSLWLGAACPDCAFTLFSGDNRTSELLEAAAESGDNFEVLAKPVHPEDLLGLVAKSLPAPEVPTHCAGTSVN